MMLISAHSFLSTLKATLARQGIDFEAEVESFGQVRASEERARGKQFTLAEHVRGLVLSLLSNQRPWQRIAENLVRIKEIFSGFAPDVLRAKNPEELIRDIRAIKCGHRPIRIQMLTLRTNIETLERIAWDYGSVDQFVTSAEPDIIAKKLSVPSSPYKLKQVGYALALEYLRNVGIRAGKPDVHIRRFLSGKRMAFVAGEPSEEEAYHLIARLASDAGCNATYLDNLIWMFCAKDYTNICGATPRCSVCGFTGVCSYHKAFILHTTQNES